MSSSSISSSSICSLGAAGVPVAGAAVAGAEGVTTGAVGVGSTLMAGSVLAGSVGALASAFFSAALPDLIMITWPTLILRGSEMPLRSEIALMLVPCFLAMAPRVSPALIV